MATQKRLGRGLKELLGTTALDPNQLEPKQLEPRAPDAKGLVRDHGVAQAVANDVDRHFLEMPLSALKPGKYQPRGEIDETSLNELVDSVRRQGVLQPLVVRQVAATDAEVTHEIVAGERRWRAAGLAGLQQVPVLEYTLDDHEALAIALIENLQREDLNAIEVASSLQRLHSEFALTHNDIAEAVGRSRSSVTNFLRLLDLDDAVKSRLAAQELDMGHARALLTLEPDEQRELAARIVKQGWSVRETERRIRKAKKSPGSQSLAPAVDLQTRWLQQQLAAESGLQVAFRERRDGKRVLDVQFADLGELQEALKRIEALIGQLRETAGPRAREHT